MSNLSDWADWQVGGGNSESKTVGYVFDALEDSVGVDVGVSSLGDTVGGFDFVFGAVSVVVAVGVLAEFVLSVELAFYGAWDYGGSDGRDGGVSQRGGGYVRVVKGGGGVSEGSSRVDGRYGVGDGTFLTSQSGEGFSVSGKVLSFSSNNFWGFKWSNGTTWMSNYGSVVNYSWGSYYGWSGNDMGSLLRNVGGCYTEAVNRIGNISGVLYDAVSIDVAVTSSGDSIEGSGFLFSGWTTGVAVAVLA